MRPGAERLESAGCQACDGGKVLRNGAEDVPKQGLKPKWFDQKAMRHARFRGHTKMLGASTDGFPQQFKEQTLSTRSKIY